MSPLTVVFDIDGTLCDTCDVDDELFCATAAAQLGVPVESISWAESPHVTDTGISAWLWERHHRRAPTLRESEAFASAFERALQAEWARAPARFAPIPGARRLLDQLAASGAQLAIATGGRANTARFKLKAASLDVDRLLASSDDSPDRRVIFDLALRRLRNRQPDASLSPVLVGDGVWDVRTAQQLGWRMVGVGSGAKAQRLRDAGAATVLSDFTDVAAATEALHSASVPRAG